MKNTKILPISIATIILIAFCSISFIIYDASESVAIRGIVGSYAEAYAKENKVEFISIDDSENDKVEIPSDNKKEDSVDDKKLDEAQTEKGNELFSYNYENKTVTITNYKGTSNEIVIPETIDNLPVKTISLNFLNRGVSIVEIPESVTAIHTDFTSPRYTANFYTIIAIMALGYVFVIVSTLIGFKKSKTAEGTFYGIPFVYSGMSTYIVITVWSTIALFLGFSPILQIIVAIIIFAITIGKLLKKAVARELVVERGEQIKQQTAFIKMLTVDADSIIARANSDEMKAEAKKVYEAIRYSDPMSSNALASIENQIQNRFNAFSKAVAVDDKELAKSTANELVMLIKNRNDKCKLLK